MKYATIKEFARKNKESSAWPSSEAALYALRQGSPGNGFDEVFHKVGRRVLIDENRFWESIKKMNEKRKPKAQ